MTDTADTWRAWKESTFGSEYMIWHDGLDIDAVTRLRGDPRAHAVDMLRLGLSLHDAHAAQALAAMGEAADRDAILAQISRTTGAQRVRLALAAHRLRPDPALSAHLIAVLNSAAHWGERIDAAIGLRHFTAPTDEPALLDALGDRDYLVRYHASETLLARWHIHPTDISKHPRIFELIRPDGPITAAAHAEARALLRSLRR